MSKNRSEICSICKSGNQAGICTAPAASIFTWTCLAPAMATIFRREHDHGRLLAAGDRDLPSDATNDRRPLKTKM